MAAAADDLRALVLEKAEFLSGRLKELISSGQGFVRAQFGLDLGLKPELYPGWMVLMALLLLVVLSWAALCGGPLAGKQRGSPVSPAGGGGGGGEGGEPMIKPPHFIKTAKPEEQKKKNKKKSTDKKVQSNGGVVVASQEEVNVSEPAVSKPSPEIKTEKVEQAPTTQAKKNKRKAKAEAKPTQKMYTTDGKEEDGAWETKVSSREKRQLRRKDKGPEDSGSPGTVEAPSGHVEPPAAPAATNSRKHRESQHTRSSGKGDAGSAPASSGWREEPSVNGVSLKMACGLEGEKWSSGSSASRHRAQPETQCWGQETQGTWSGVDGRMKADLNPVSFSMLGANATEPMSHPIDLQWDRHPDVSDEWSGFNGMTAVDPSSDWNAPAEHWGNYEEPPVLVTPAAPPKEQAAPLKVSEDEKEVEDPSEGTAKSKKKKKKKKKAEEDVAAVTQTVSEVSHEAPPIMPSSQKKSEQTVESSKSSQKKKVRRET